MGSKRSCRSSSARSTVLHGWRLRPITFHPSTRSTLAQGKLFTFHLVQRLKKPVRPRSEDELLRRFGAAVDPRFLRSV